jgi:peptide/nickel transport system permease protein
MRVARRLVWALAIVLGVAALSFFVSEVLPGDPARMLVGPHASASDVARVRSLYGLDRPLPARFGHYLAHLVHPGPTPLDRKASDAHRSCGVVAPGLHVDLGFSFHHRKPVVDLLAAKLPRSMELALAALLVELAVGLAAGAFAAHRRGTRADELTMGATLLTVSAPTFLLGLVLQYVLAYRLRLLPYDGYGSTPAEHLASIVLPALTLGLFGSALYARVVRDELGVLLRQEFVRAARAKGASPLRVLVVHGLRNALVPIATMAALDLGALVGGAIVTEKLFRWPGVGQLAVEALLNRDGPVIFGTVLVSSAAVVLSMLLLDVLHVALDPRQRSR